MKKFFKGVLSVIQIASVIVLMACAYLFFVQELSPKAALCTLVGGKYYVLAGCVPAPKLVLPLSIGGGE